MGGAGRGARHLQRRRLRRRPGVAHRAHPAARRRGRHRQRAAERGALRPRPEERHLPGAGPRGLQQLRRGHQGHRPAHGRAEGLDEEGPRRDRPSGGRAGRGRRVRDGRRLQRPAAGVVLAAQPRGGHRQSDEADLGRRPGRRRGPPDGGHARRRPGRQGRRARAPDDGHGHLPREPAQARQGLLRDRHRVGARRPAELRAQHGDGRRLEPGDARRHAGHPQRRGARRHRPRPAHGARQQAALRLVDDGHGPAAGGGLRRHAGVRADQRRRGAARQAVPPAELHRRCVGGQQAQ